MERETETSINNGEAVLAKSIERLEIEYFVLSITGAYTEIQARIFEAVLTGPDAPQTTQRLNELRKIPVRIYVAVNGSVNELSGGNDLLQHLANGDPEAAQLLEATCSDRVLMSWFCRPFWLTPPATEPATNDPLKWEQLDYISLGVLGQLRSVVEFSFKPDNDGSGKVDISGNWRHHLSPGSMEDAEEKVMTFSDIEASVTSFKGTGEILLKEPKSEADTSPEPAAPDDAGPSLSHRRPWFGSMDLQWSVKASAKIEHGDQKHNIELQQTMKHSLRLLPGYQMRQRVQFPIFRIPNKG